VEYFYKRFFLNLLVSLTLVFSLGSGQAVGASLEDIETDLRIAEDNLQQIRDLTDIPDGWTHNGARTAIQVRSDTGLAKIVLMLDAVGQPPIDFREIFGTGVSLYEVALYFEGHNEDFTGGEGVLMRLTSEYLEATLGYMDALVEESEDSALVQAWESISGTTLR